MLVCVSPLLGPQRKKKTCPGTHTIFFLSLQAENENFAMKLGRRLMHGVSRMIFFAEEDRSRSSSIYKAT